MKSLCDKYLSKKQFQPSIDYKLFVNNLNLDEIPYDEDDNEEDPEYMVPTDAIFRDDRDDFMGDYWSSTIPRELFICYYLFIIDFFRERDGRFNRRYCP